MQTHMCMCVCACNKGIFMCVNVGISIEVKGQPLVWGLTFHPVSDRVFVVFLLHTPG